MKKPVRHSFGVLVFYLTFGAQRGAQGEGPSCDEWDLQPPRVWPALDQVTLSPLWDHSTVWQDTG